MLLTHIARPKNMADFIDWAFQTGNQHLQVVLGARDQVKGAVRAGFRALSRPRSLDPKTVYEGFYGSGRVQGRRLYLQVAPVIEKSANGGQKCLPKT